jgi:ABC-type oligopeptide transport system ATPase subunit
LKQLRVRGLSKSFPVKYDWLGRPRQFVDAVTDVNLEISNGETLALVGESGSGKSTVARLIVHLIRPDTGCVEIDGEPLPALGRDELRRMRRRLQIVFQDPYSSLDPSLSIRDILCEPFRVHRLAVSSKILEKLLADVGLSESFLTRMPHELSGGQRQRVAIARALAVEPEFIACDEIVSALDVSTRAQILNLLSTIQEKRGLSMLFITHDLATVPFIAHRVAVIYLGRIVEQGTVDEVLTRPRHPYTKTLLASVPLPDPSTRTRDTFEVSVPETPITLAESR